MEKPGHTESRRLTIDYIEFFHDIPGLIGVRPPSPAPTKQTPNNYDRLVMKNTPIAHQPPPKRGYDRRNKNRSPPCKSRLARLVSQEASFLGQGDVYLLC